MAGFALPKRAVDITGLRFGRLTAIEPVGSAREGGVLWRCICDCGASVTGLAKQMRKGELKSCGCWLQEVMQKRGTKSKELTHERLLELLHYDPATGEFRWRQDRKWNVAAGSIAGGSDGKGYIHIKIDQNHYFAHRLAWFYMTGGWPPSGEVDHINTVRDDNRWVNLRDATRQINAQNLRAPQRQSASGLLGVSREGRRWRARVFKNGRERFRAYFATPEEAHQAYLTAKRDLHEGCTI